MSPLKVHDIRSSQGSNYIRLSLNELESVDVPKYLEKELSHISIDHKKKLTSLGTEDSKKYIDYRQPYR